jgi:hypothetical protein
MPVAGLPDAIAGSHGGERLSGPTRQLMLRIAFRGVRMNEPARVACL